MPDIDTLVVDRLDVFYGAAHALQGVTFSVADGMLAVVGKNGMGKSTLCKAILGLVPFKGSIQFKGKELCGLTSYEIARLGIGYVPQGRRLWKSLTVNEHLVLGQKTGRAGSWNIERIYSTFPRLAERKSNFGDQLSGGEQQMLAISRALLANPSLLVMDEPTEGLAPVIVNQVGALLRVLTEDKSVSILLIEQNLRLALAVSDTVQVMTNGRLGEKYESTALQGDTQLQLSLLGLSPSADQQSHSAPDQGVLA